MKGLQCKFQLLYRVERALTDSNYLIRKVGTSHTQIAHRIQLHPIKPQHQINDLEIIDPKNLAVIHQLIKMLKNPNSWINKLTVLAFPFLREFLMLTKCLLLTSNFHFHGKEKLSNCHPHNRLIKTHSNTSFNNPSRRTSLCTSTSLSSPTISRPQTPIETNYNLDDSHLFTPPTASTLQLTQRNMTASPNVSPTQTENSEVFIVENQGPIRPPFRQPEVIRVPEHLGSRNSHQNSPGQPFTYTQPTLHQSPMFAPFYARPPLVRPPASLVNHNRPQTMGIIGNPDTPPLPPRRSSSRIRSQTEFYNNPIHHDATRMPRR